MKLNDIDLESYAERENEVTFILTGTVGLDDVMALDGEVLTITSNGAEYRKYEGYSLMSAGYTDQSAEHMSARFFRKLSDQTESAINQLDANVATIQAAAESAQQTAQAAMETAQEAGADPQVATIAKLTAPSIDFEAVSATDCVAIPDYVPEWEPGIKLGKNAPVMRNGQLYRASQAIESAQEQYPPETAGESLYYPVYVDDDGIIIYRECHGEYDMVRKGEKRHYPGAGDPVYIALEDTAYSPDAYPQHWQLVEEG
ncbi:hypothetical protein QUW41_07215 [Slackia piriformis]|nr:hypothetical protein [Slackia piriformis]